MTRTASAARPLRFEPDYAVPPGRTLLELIEHKGIDQRELALRLGVSAKHVNQIILGKAAITHDTAIRLESVTGTPARFWNNLERDFQEHRARARQTERLNAEASWVRSLPIADLAKRGVLAAKGSAVDLAQRALAFFGVADVDAWKQLWTAPEVAFRQSPAYEARPGAMACWIRLAQLQAERVACRPYDAYRFRTALEQIRGLTVLGPDRFVPKMTLLCAEAGVALVLVQEIKGAPVSGAAQWLATDRAMIALNLRGKSNDKFWFNFFHESCHILRHGKRRPFLDGSGTPPDDPQEREANDFAANFLIPPDRLPEVEAIQSQEDVKALAKSLGVHPGIVAGRYQHHTKQYTHFNGLKMKLVWAENDT